VSVVVNDFYAKIEARKGAEQVLIKPAALALVVNIFLRHPVLFKFKFMVGTLCLNFIGEFLLAM
jgi:hypothetical protein